MHCILCITQYTLKEDVMESISNRLEPLFLLFILFTIASDKTYIPLPDSLSYSPLTRPGDG